MKPMGFYVKCLSAQIHTDPFTTGMEWGGVSGAAEELVHVRARVCCSRILMSIYLFPLNCSVCVCI